WRSTSRTHSARASGAYGSTRRSRSSTARCGRRWATSSRPASTRGSWRRCATRSTRPGSARARSSPPAASPWTRSANSSATAGVPHVASADDHELTDAEISDEPDYSSTYPPHCLRGTRGAEKVAETQQSDPVPLALTEVPAKWLEGREYLLLKKSFDVFTNPNADRLLELLRPDEIVLFGVATDVCDDAAIRGFIERGGPVVFV